MNHERRQSTAPSLGTLAWCAGAAAALLVGCGGGALPRPAGEPASGRTATVGAVAGGSRLSFQNCGNALYGTVGEVNFEHVDIESAITHPWWMAFAAAEEYDIYGTSGGVSGYLKYTKAPGSQITLGTAPHRIYAYPVQGNVTNRGAFTGNFTNTLPMDVVVNLTNAIATAVFTWNNTNMVPADANPATAVLRPRWYLTNSAGGGYWYAK